MTRRMTRLAPPKPARRRRRWFRERSPGDLPPRAAGVLLLAPGLRGAVLLPAGQRHHLHLSGGPAQRSPLGRGAAPRVLLPHHLAAAAADRAGADHAPDQRGAAL